MAVDFIKTLTKKAQGASWDMEDLLLQGGNFSNLPTLPLYLILRKLPVEKTALFLDKCSPAQRQYFLDMDLWNKDELNLEEFSYWIHAYYHCQTEDVKKEFVQGAAFALYLKGRFNLMCFDGEHPIYPDHDHFFITDDNMILVEYDQDFDHVLELKALIGQLYASLGVGAAWATLFKIISDSFTALAEEEYGQKKERLRDTGMVDYYEALPFLHVFKDQNAIDRFVDNKKEVTGAIDEVAKKELPHPWALTAGQWHVEKMMEEFSYVGEKRREFLIFDFTRLINGTLCLEDVLNKSSIAIGRVGNITKNRISLGFWYAKKKSNRKFFFEKFTFSDIYKIGRSLVVQEEKRLKKVLGQTSFAENNTFLGEQITRHLVESFDDYLKSKLQKEEDIADVFQTWTDKNQTIIEVIPYAEKFHQTFKTIIKTQQVLDGFYINYKVEDLDFEPLLISNFVNFTLGFKAESSRKKLAVSIDEFKKFHRLFFDEQGKLRPQNDLEDKIKEFASFYGLDRVFMFIQYFTTVLDAHLAGYKPDELKKEDFRYIGGPVIFDYNEGKSLAHSKSNP